MTKASVTALAGTGLIGVAKDNLKREGVVPAMAVGFVEIELDIETGKYEILDYVGVAECGTVLHPQGLETQIKGGAVMGFGLAALERYVYDPQNGLPANTGLYQCKPPSYLDVPSQMKTEVVDIADLKIQLVPRELASLCRVVPPPRFCARFQTRWMGIILIACQ